MKETFKNTVEEFDKEIASIGEDKWKLDSKINECKLKLFALYSKNPDTYPYSSIVSLVKGWKKKYGLFCSDFEFLYPSIIFPDYSALKDRSINNI